MFYDNYVESKIMVDVKAMEGRVMDEVKTVQQDIKTVSGTVSEIKGSVDTLIKLLEDRKANRT